VLWQLRNIFFLIPKGSLSSNGRDDSRNAGVPATSARPKSNVARMPIAQLKEVWEESEAYLDEELG